MNNKNNKNNKSKLTIKLVFSLIIAIIFASITFFVVLLSAYEFTFQLTNTTDYITKQQEKFIDKLQKCIYKYNITKDNISDIENYYQSIFDTNITIFYDNQIIYNNYQIFENEQGIQDTALEEFSLLYNKVALSEITLSDNTKVQVSIGTIQPIEWFILSLVISIICAFAVFLSIMILFVNKKIQYVLNLQKELKILECGDLSHNITITGNDELAELALNIDNMRKAIIERQEGEEEAKKANQELITAMSHDLRTPLTSLLGYIDIMEQKKYSSEEQLNHFLHTAKEKAYLIKSVSDKLFEYFFVYSKESGPLNIERINANMYLQQMLSEQCFELECNNFKTILSIQDFNIEILIDIEIMHRAFNNIFSNIKKYANNNFPIVIDAYIKNKSLFVIFKNITKADLDKVESNNIGLKTCEKSILLQNGFFQTQLNNDEYITRIILDVYQ